MYWFFSSFVSACKATNFLLKKKAEYQLFSKKTDDPLFYKQLNIKNK